ncbi:SDR family oxidoreductase [Paroceanicella profunda]|uniref:SDR family oxidoreductase n=1 Tax=Paroceanicella profunda TaxID=2579971 RepID=A0A5B8FQ70_9RHOB|nr:SDR family oxidoreductase [Paroceanicella profunda]QDL90746.1 SDR family oxidoreductase [Paroceanicella profunda]
MSDSRTTVLVTGASSGIGAVYAERFAARGHDLLLVARDAGRLEALAQRLAAEHGVTARPLAADLTREADLARVEAILREDASIDHLVNNAGFGGVTPLIDSDVDEMQRMIAINVTAPMRLAHAAVPAFVARGAGVIVNISSIVAVGPEILNGVYGGTKAFMLAFSQSLAKELAGTGVRVQVVLPGATGTAFWDTAGMPASQMPASWVMTPQDLVDAALAGLDRGEFATMPSLQDGALWDAWEAARQAMIPNLSSSRPAPRYAGAPAA